LGGAVGCRVSEADYDAWLIDICRGDQFGSAFVDLNPNSKIQLWLTIAPSSPFAFLNRAPSCFTWRKSSGRSIPL